jgi:hypothetical protein
MLTDEVLSQVTTVAVDDEESVRSTAARSLLRTAIKHLLQLCQSNVVVALT